jgi:hypothetical protein
MDYGHFARFVAEVFSAVKGVIDICRAAVIIRGSFPYILFAPFTVYRPQML